MSAVRNRLAVSLAPATTADALATLHRVAPLVGLAEIRLDAMGSFDLATLAAASPVPLIATCRPTREGGRYQGSETDRLGILCEAAEHGFAYIDVEWDALEQLAARGPADPAWLIASRHWTDEMPPDLWPSYAELRDRADVVKLVGMANRVADVIPVLDLWARATTPVIALAMGQAGLLTRLLALCVPQSLLTYAALDESAMTAPGQLSLEEMITRYRLHEVGPQTPVQIHVRRATEESLAFNDGNTLHITLPAGDHVPFVIAALRGAMPHGSVNIAELSGPREDDGLADD